MAYDDNDGVAEDEKNDQYYDICHRDLGKFCQFSNIFLCSIKYLFVNCEKYNYASRIALWWCNSCLGLKKMWVIRKGEVQGWGDR